MTNDELIEYFERHTLAYAVAAANSKEEIDADAKGEEAKAELLRRLGAAVSASPQPEKWPQHCDFCNQDMESADDRTEWHGLGNCVPVCMVCMGSGIEPSKVDCPDCCGKGKTPTASAQVPWKLCPMCKATGKISSKPFAAAPAQEPRQDLYVISSTGDGAQTIIVPESRLRQSAHDTYCSCGLAWQKCADEAITETLAKLDDEEEWTQEYPNYKRHTWSDHGEDYTVTIMRVTAAQEQPVENRCTYFDAECLKRMNAVSGDAPKVEEITRDLIEAVTQREYDKVDAIVISLRRGPYSPPASQTPQIDWQKWYQKTADFVGGIRKELGLPDGDTHAIDHLIVIRDFLKKSGLIPPPASTARTDEPSELLEVLGAIEGVSGDDFCADLDMRNANRKLHGALATAYEKLGQIYRLSHGFNTQNSCHHVHTNWREELKKCAAPGSVPQAGITTAGEMRARIAAATDEEMQPLRDALRIAVDHFGSDDSEQDTGVPQAEPPKEEKP